MSHVDDGTLHAYLDGELTAVEQERLEAHLAMCEACQARLTEERGLVERASRILGRAVPPTHYPPALATLRRPRLGWRPRMPFVWAATVLLALGIGWYARDLGADRHPLDSASTSSPLADRPAAKSQVAPADAPSAPEGPSRFRQEAAKPSAAPPVSAGRNQPELAAAAESDEHPPATVETGAVAKVADRLAEAAPPAQVRGARAPAPAAGNGIVLTQPAVAGQATLQLTTAWPLIESKPARDLLGVAPATIPGYPVRAMRRNPADAAEVLVEQEIASGLVVQLYESKAELQASGAVVPADRRRDAAPAERRLDNERLARFVGALRIEISGPLSVDSLSALLQLVR